jgi:regulator of replication initiation timing
MSEKHTPDLLAENAKLAAENKRLKARVEEISKLIYFECLRVKKELNATPRSDREDRAYYEGMSLGVLKIKNAVTQALKEDT